MDKKQKYEYIVKDYRRHAGRSTKKFPDGKTWSLSESFAVKLLKSICYFCGRAGQNTFRGLKYNGIDRIDSSKGYTEDNVRPACGDCNKAKSEMSESDFIKLAKRIAERHS